MDEAIHGLHVAGMLADTLQSVVDGVVNGLGYELAFMHLVRPDGDLVLASCAGDSAEALITGRVSSRASWDRRLNMGEAWGNLRFIPHTEGWILDDDVPEWHNKEDGPARRFKEGWHPSDRLYAPMYTPGTSGGSGGELIGVLSVARPRNHRPPSPDQREALQSYAFHAAIAVGSARMRATMQRALVRLEREQEILRASEESFRQAFEYAPSGFAIAELGGEQHGRILRTNDALCRLLGRSASGLRRLAFSDLVHPEDMGILLRTSAEGGRAELRLGRRDGTYVWVSLRNSVVADAPDGPRFILTHIEDIEERKHRELQLMHQVSHDPLTSLPNVTELRTRLNSRLCIDAHRPADAAPHEDGTLSHIHLEPPADDAGDGAKGLAVLVCDLDGFKSINDRFGHHTGDMVLVEVAQRLTNRIPDGGVVGRVGGNEFAVLADGLTRADTADLAVRLRNAIIPPIRVDGRAVRVGASFGIGWARCGMTADEVLKSADEQMYVEKRSRPRQHRRTG
ncbi:diguanylate cyclase CdgB [Streptomyces sp. NBC_01728]|uniref:diguanylate cyclase CdgB n=1 Tax=unclassified Streptomyces TaxID=2593676 RepID=UPI00225B9B84|nr:MULTISPECIES: diguanylate cyclase CdgB [unclassified Streptomyces]MCX4461207.1 diguanylate cyclase CdgB [Streptomyces sp. NBC_01719]MCX4490115.1 diguanylate cyclase CdgB [Streptomyces sp. NBC_01728]